MLHKLFFERDPDTFLRQNVSPNIHEQSTTQDKQIIIIFPSSFIEQEETCKNPQAGRFILGPTPAEEESQPTGPHSLLEALGLGRGPHLLPIPLHHHGTVVAQPHAAGLEAAGGLALGLPHHLVVSFVHDEVAVVLHAQAVGITLAGCVRVPHGLPAVDDKVAIILQRESVEGGDMGIVHFFFNMCFSF